MFSKARSGRFPYLRTGLWLLVVGSLPLRADDPDAKMKGVMHGLQSEMKQEMEALRKLSDQTVEVDKQLAAIRELKGMKEDLDNLRRNRKDLLKGDETASSQLDEAKVTILESAEKVQAAKSNQDIEKALSQAKDKIAALKKKMALVDKEKKDLALVKAEAAKEIEELLEDLARLKKKYKKELAQNEKIRKQFDSLHIEVLKLKVRLKESETVARAKEIARVVLGARERIAILKSNLKTVRQGGGAKEIKSLPPSTLKDRWEDLDTDIYMTAPLEVIRMLFSKDRISVLYFNTLQHFISDEVVKVGLLLKLVLIGLVGSLLLCILIQRKL
jgi:DNA repair exonuclease SbcCD ATPase subunit